MIARLPKKLPRHYGRVLPKYEMKWSVKSSNRSSRGGFVLLTLKLGGAVTEATGAIELLSTKTGLVLIVLAISHFFHLALYARIHGKPRPLGDPTRGAGIVTAEMVKA